MRQNLLLIPLLATLALPAWADAYKCKMPDGQTVISSDPCSASSRTEAVRPSEKIAPEQKREAEQRAARDRERLADQEKARAEEDKRREEERRHVVDDAAVRKTRCLDNAQLEPDPTLRANLIAACNGVAPQAPTVVQQPVYVPVPTHPRPQPSAIQLCIGKGCTGPAPTHTPAPGAGVNLPPGKAPIAPGAGGTRCRLVAGVQRCD